ncbi:PH domain-containing protein [Marinilactibacillus kalidii]|uniref:PH domain-containing protein n=1 Tax=Marinilactibacillus kalidii TaxID=2820274 RepID=UPI001ABE97D7|nr:PH domain-containing protein [Marinilactibacillus kalidii]
MIEENAPLHKLDKAVIQYDKTNSLVNGLFYAIGCAVLLYIIDRFEWPIVYAVLLIILTVFIFCIDYFVLPYLRYKSIRYEVHPTYLEILKGIFFRTREVIPIERIQQVLIKDNPISRRYRVQSVEIQTAGTNHTVPLLLEKEAQALKKGMMERIKEVQSDV